MNNFQIHLPISIKWSILIVFLFWNGFTFAQEKYSVTGKVKIENGNIDNTFITIYKNANKIESKLLDNSGKFNYELDFGNDYIFEFSKEGFVTKKVSISTFVPEDVLSRDSQFPPFKFMVSLFPAYKGLDLSIFNQPMGIIMYDKELDDFDYDRDYDTQIRDAIRKAEEAARKRAAELEAQRLAKEKAYKGAIQKGDINFRNRKYEEAKLAYTDALQIKADESYPKDQIVKIDQLLSAQQQEVEEAARLAAEQKALDEKYASIIALGDSQFTASDYTSAKSTYTDALQLKADETYPKEQISKIDQLLAAQQQKAEESARLAAEKKALDEKYNALIAQGDSQFTASDYTSAKSTYTDALQLKADETYPKDQISKIDQLLSAQQQEAKEAARLAAEKKALDEKYNALIAQGDSQFASGDYTSAKSTYTDALQLKADESYPKEQISKIDQLLAAQQQKAEESARLAAEKKALDEKYNALIAQGDFQFTANDYTSAKSTYTDALQLKADETYPKDQISKIDQLLAAQQQEAEQAARLAAEQKALDEKYNALIAQGDSQFTSSDYTSAKSTYTDALQLKADETYPKEQISKIDQLLAAQQQEAKEAARLAAEKKALNEKYNALIAQGDSQFTSSDYTSAKSTYTDALQVKAEERYPKDQLKKISALLKEQKRKEEEQARLLAQQQLHDAKYQKLIQSADKSFELKQWNIAMRDFHAALKIKPDETYPKSKIEEIEKILNEIEQKAKAKSEMQKEYEKLIATSDKQFNNEEYDFAKVGYEKALEIYPKKSYPQEQLKRIDVLLERKALAAKKEKEINQRYSEELEKAESFFKQDQYSVARHHYQAALKIKPKEKYPKEKLNEISKRLQALKKAEQEMIAENPANFEKKLSIIKEKEYAEMIAKADQSFQSKHYTVSKVMYERALKFFDREYPKKQLKEIKKLIRENKYLELSEEYRQKIAQADKELAKKHYAVAKFYYQKALRINAKEKYPASQLEKIDKLLASQKNAKIDKEYKSILRKADEAFDKGNLTVARFYYRKALELKKDENYPKEKLKMIRTKQSKQ